ncbi:MAG: IcmT/TraK family protein [Candidatus Berkiella sp.]
MRHPHTAHWRDSGRIPKFFFMDAYSAIPLLLFLLHIRLWTFALACCVCLFFVILNRFGFSLPIFVRWLRSFVAGKDRYARTWLAHKPHSE